MKMMQINLKLNRAKKAWAIFSLSGLSGVLFVIALLAGLSVQPIPSTAQQEPERCGTMGRYEWMKRLDPRFPVRRLEIERVTREYLANRVRRDFGAISEPVTIPVVVHVVYNTDEQNISDEQIRSQIDILNQDFRRMNPDVGSVPEEFRSVEADTRIQFQLAVRGPDCEPTSGITRTRTSVRAFNYEDDGIKFNRTGGHDTWPSDKYLNIWVAPAFSFRGLLGYSSFPGDPAETDGVVIIHDAFGDRGTARAPERLKRTATHEVGHWLNLWHIFRAGDAGGGFERTGCAGTTEANCATEGDEVCDTPPTRYDNSSCPTAQNTCSETPFDHRDQTMNYMDYTDASCKFMFTVGQAERMEAALFTTRASILASDGLIPPPATAAADLWAQDTPSDTGAEPNTTGDAMYVSSDIWVRPTNDGRIDQEHRNPAHGATNYVYVRVRNKSCSEAGEGIVRLYWAKASTALSWPAPWDGSVTAPALMGREIGVQPTGRVAAGGYVILEFPWNPPNPADYASFGADLSHFCLLARIETGGMTFPEDTDLYANVQNNNNIVWKNVSVVGSDSGRSSESAVTVGNLHKAPALGAWVFGATGGKEFPLIFKWGEVSVDLGKELFSKWQRGGAQGYGIKVVDSHTIQVLSPNAWIANVELKPYELHTIKLRFTPYKQSLVGVSVYDFRVEQYQLAGKSYRLVGGEKFVLKTDYRR